MAVGLGWFRAHAWWCYPALAFGVLGCGGGADTPAPAPAPAPTPTEPANGPYELHEWGLIAASSSADTLRALSAPRSVGNVFSGLSGGGGGGGGLHEMGGIGKPVLYFHLDDGTDALDLAVGVRATGGQVVEHFPAGVLSEENTVLRWPSVRVTRGACRGTYPGPADPACQTSDGLCEAAEVASYESAAADCVQVGEQRGGVLLYRTGPSTAGLPLRVAVDPTGQVSVQRAMAGPEGEASPQAGWVMRITRGETRALTRVQIVPLGADGSASVPPAETTAPGADAGHAHLRDALTAAGLDDAERDAFLTAWSEALFGADPLADGAGGLGDTLGTSPGGSAIPPGGAGYAPPRLRPPPRGVGSGEAGLVGTLGGGGLGFRHALGSVADALIFLVPQADVDALLPLDLQPPPRVLRRVFLARVEIVPARLTLRVGAVLVRGGLDSQVTRRILLRATPRLRECLSPTGPVGTLRVELRILTTGAVDRASVDGVELERPQHACLLEQLSTIQFPEDDAVTQLIAPITVSR
ncbi:MAG: hypothetical protein KBB95_24580 [Deltaproteobacteria bacterium]|nr:hypothetical protein [Deltaproteobacteria bacterium]